MDNVRSQPHHQGHPAMPSPHPKYPPQPTHGPVPAASRPTSFLDDTWSWSHPPSWPLTIRFLPLGILLTAVWIAVSFPDTFGDLPARLTADATCAGSFNYTFHIARAKVHAETLATHDWEIGAAAEAVLELVEPGKAVFSAHPFPGGRVPGGFWGVGEAGEFVMGKVQVGGGRTLVRNAYSVSDPAALGVSAVMLGRRRGEWWRAAGRQMEFLLHDAPRYGNGAISHRVAVAELWSDAVFMFPPFLAYYGVASGDVGLVGEAVRQVELYRDVLVVKEGKGRGLWRHIVGDSEMADKGAWSTGNGWAAYGIARVRATVVGWRRSGEAMREEVERLDGYVEEILQGAMRSDSHDSGLLRNYLDDDTSFGDTAGTALLAAAAYRLVMFEGTGETKHSAILRWADEKRRAVFKHVDEDGVASPVVNSLKHDQREPFDGINPEAQSFLLLLGAAWRDCVCAGVCSSNT